MPPHRTMSIGQVAAESEVPITTLRYYERVGVLVPVARVGGQRRYDRGSLARLEVINVCKRAGFSLDEVRLLYEDDSAARAISRDLARRKLDHIDEQISELRRAKEIIEWGLRCTCDRLDSCTCGIHDDRSPLG